MLYHFTSPEHLKSIEADGVITTTESNVNAFGGGPRVVWLTDDPDPGKAGWAEGSLYDKTAVRITVEVPDAYPWLAWAGEQGIEEYWKNALVSAGGGPDAAASWWVVERPVHTSEWEILEVRGDG
jgi:hypothetical protein